jgi:hypothetical protein
LKVQTCLPYLSEEIISLSGIGFNDTSQRGYFNLEGQYLSHIHSSIEKSFIERTIQYIKDRTEYFDDYFLCTRINCKLEHIMNWLVLFVDMHNRARDKAKDC